MERWGLRLEAVATPTTRVLSSASRLVTIDLRTWRGRQLSELIAIIFKDQYRASEVLNDLQRREWDWGADLDQAVVVRHTEKEEYKVLFSFDPMTETGGSWARLWGSLLSLVLFDPLTEGIVQTVASFSEASGAPARLDFDKQKRLPDVKWWRERLRLSKEFVRDVGAMVQPGDSALVALLHADRPGFVFQQLRNYGGTLVHTRLTAEQDWQLQHALSGD